MHAVIIEDEYLVAASIEDALREIGFTSFVIAATEEEALASVRERQPDLITSDVRLARGNGIDAVQKICRVANIPVLFITGSADQIQLRCPDAAFVEKPFCANHIHAGVNRAWDALNCFQR